MAKAIDLGVTGILQPALTHRWRVEFKEAPSLTAMVLKIDINLIKKEFTVYVEQSVTGTEFLEIDNICQSTRNKSVIHKDEHNIEMEFPYIGGSTVNIFSLDGNNNVYFKLEFLNSKVKESKVSFDYSISKVLTHVLIFKYNEMIVHIIKNN